MAVTHPRERIPRRPLSDAQLQELYDHLDEVLRREGCDLTHRLTKEFLTSRGVAVRPALDWMESQGGYCDCEVYMNVAWADW